MVIDFIQQIGVLKAEKKYLHFARIDRIESLKEVEGVVFIANPDMLAGLTTWAYYDNNAEDGVVSMFGSGCSCIVTQATIEKSKRRQTDIHRFLRSVGTSLLEPDKIELYYTYVQIQGNVWHNAPKLLIRYSCLGKDPGKNG